MMNNAKRLALVLGASLSLVGCSAAPVIYNHVHEAWTSSFDNYAHNCYALWEPFKADDLLNNGASLPISWACDVWEDDTGAAVWDSSHLKTVYLSDLSSGYGYYYAYVPYSSAYYAPIRMGLFQYVSTSANPPTWLLSRSVFAFSLSSVANSWRANIYGGTFLTDDFYFNSSMVFDGTSLTWASTTSGVRVVNLDSSASTLVVTMSNCTIVPYAYDDGYTAGSLDGEQNGWEEGIHEGISEGYSDGYRVGYSSGYAEAVETGAAGYEVIDFFSIFSAVITMPFTFIQQGFNFTLFDGTIYEFNAGVFLGSVLVILMIWKILQLVFKFGK